MTIVLIGKDLVLEGPRPKIEDKQVPVPGKSDQHFCALHSQNPHQKRRFAWSVVGKCSKNILPNGG